MDIDAKKEGTLDGKYKESKTIELRECAKKIDDTRAKEIMEKVTMD